MADDFALPIHERHFEDYVAGAVYEYGSLTVDAEQILQFAREYDHQPLHTEAATGGPFGEPIASGWHTTALMMRLFTDNYVSGAASLGGLGVDELRWLLPVRAGDVLRLRVSVLETRRSQSKPDRGVLRTLVEILNANDAVVLRLIVINLMRLRDPGAFADKPIRPPAVDASS